MDVACQWKGGRTSVGVRGGVANPWKWHVIMSVGLGHQWGSNCMSVWGGTAIGGGGVTHHGRGGPLVWDGKETRVTC